MLDDVITGITAMLKPLNLFADPQVGAALPGNSIGLYLSGGSASEFLTRGRHDAPLLVVNVKHADQRTTIQAGDAITDKLTKRGAAYPAGQSWKIESIKTATPLSYVDRDESGEFIYSVVFEIQITTKRGE